MDHDFKDAITSTFSLYLEPLARFVLYFRHILQEAYRSRNFDGLHEKFLRAFKVAEETSKFQTRHDGKENAIYRTTEQAVGERWRGWLGPDSPLAERIQSQPADTPVISRKRSRPARSGMSRISEDEEGELPVIAPPPPSKKIKAMHGPAGEPAAVSQQSKAAKTRNALARGKNAKQAGISQQPGGRRQSARARNAQSQDQSREASPSARLQNNAKRGQKSHAGGSRTSLQQPGESGQAVDEPAAGAEGPFGEAPSSARPQDNANNSRRSSRTERR